MTKKKPQNQITEYIGWIGVILIITSYGLLSVGFLSGDSPLYHLVVLAGSVSVAVISYKKRVLQPAVLNILFAVFALIALYRLTLLP